VLVGRVPNENGSSHLLLFALMAVGCCREGMRVVAEAIVAELLAEVIVGCISGYFGFVFMSSFPSYSFLFLRNMLLLLLMPEHLLLLTKQ